MNDAIVVIFLYGIYLATLVTVGIIIPVLLWALSEEYIPINHDNFFVYITKIFITIFLEVVWVLIFAYYVLGLR